MLHINHFAKWTTDTIILLFITGHVSLAAMDKQCHEPAPLENHLGICYANATLQCLFGYESFAGFIDKSVQLTEHWNLFSEMMKGNLSLENPQAGLLSARRLMERIFPHHELHGSTIEAFLITLMQEFLLGLDNNLDNNMEQALFDGILYYIYSNEMLSQAEIIIRRNGNQDDLTWKNVRFVHDFHYDQNRLGFDVHIIVVPVFNMIVVLPQSNNIREQLLDQRFATRMENILKKVWQELKKNNNFAFVLRGLTVMLSRQKDAHEIAYVNRDNSWYLCNDELIYNVGKDFSYVIKQIYDELCSDHFGVILQRGNKFDTSKANVLFYEVIETQKNKNQNILKQQQEEQARLKYEEELRRQKEEQTRLVEERRRKQLEDDRRKQDALKRVHKKPMPKKKFAHKKVVYKVAPKKALKRTVNKVRARKVIRKKLISKKMVSKKVYKVVPKKASKRTVHKIRTRMVARKKSVSKKWRLKKR